MSDYNLGRAHGTIDIDYDGSGTRRAQADMAQTRAEAAALDASMGRVNDQFDRNQKIQIASVEDMVRARGEVDNLRRTYERLQREYDRSVEKSNEAREKSRAAREEESRDLDEMRRAAAEFSRAVDEEARLRTQAAEALDNYRTKMAAVKIEVDKFNAAHYEASNAFRKLSADAEKFGSVLESLNEKMSGVARILGQFGLFGLFGGAAGGQLFASMAGGMHVLVTAMAAVVEIGNAFVGALAMIPALANAAVLSIGTLAIAFQGVGTALGSLEDPKKFIEAIRDMSPAAQQAMLSIQSFTNAFRGARYEIQESLFAPIVADIQPLVQTWLPRLMNAGKSIANEFGQSFHQVFAYFQTSEAQNSFQIFTSNMVSGFQAARDAIEPFLQAWNKLAEVGSGLFPRLGAAITTVAEKFNAWIQRTAASGQLVEYLGKMLDAFTNMGRIIRDVAFGINNIFGVFESQSGSALQTIANLAEKFRNWSESMSGQNAIFSFFSLIKTAAEAVKPALSLMGDSLAIIGRTLTELGIAIQPGIVAFLQSFKSALEGLAPHVKEMAPAINQFLVAFGATLEKVVASLGPKLPELIQDMAIAFEDILEIIPPVVDVFARLLGMITPQQVVVFLGLVAAIKALTVTFQALSFVMAAGPFGLALAGAAALATAAYLIITNWDKVKETLGSVWDSITSGLGDVWRTIASTLDSWWDKFYEWGKSLAGRFADGIREGLSFISDAWDSLLGKGVNDKNVNSPPKTGPLSGPHDPLLAGKRLSERYAEGVSSGSPSISSAYDDAIGGFGSQKFSSAGVSGTSGYDFTQGNSGFDQWVSFITSDLMAWNNIFQQAFNIVSSIGDIVEKTVRVAANLWDGGDNPLTRPGGLFGPPLPISQQEVPGVPSKPIPGQAPDQWGRDLAAQNKLPGQQDVAGVPSVNKGGKGWFENNGATGNNPPASVTGSASPGTQGEQTVPLKQNPDGTWTSTDPTWAKLIQRESGGDPDIRQKITDVNSGGNEAEGLFQITPQTWKANGGEQFAPSAGVATPQQQAQVAARILNSDPGAWGYYRHEGREDPAALRAGLTNTGATSASSPRQTGPGTPRYKTSKDGAIPYEGLGHFDRGGVIPDLFLAHTSEGGVGTQTSEELIQYQIDQGKGYSYNNYIDSNTGAITIGVPSDLGSNGTGGTNQRAINTVFSGSTADWTREEWLQRMPALQSFAKLAAESGVPLVNIEGNTDPSAAGVGGHDWATAAGFPTDGHSDPGPNFPWDVVMDLAQQYKSNPDGTTAPSGGDVNSGTPSPYNPGNTDGGDPTAAIIGLTAFGASAALVSALQKLHAYRQTKIGEPIISDLENRLGITPAEADAVKNIPPEVAKRMPGSVRGLIPYDMRVPQTNLGNSVLPGGDNRTGRVIQVGPSGTAEVTTNQQAQARNTRYRPPPPSGATKPRVAPSINVAGPGGARLSAAGRTALTTGGYALNVLMTLPWAWDLANAIDRGEAAQDARDAGEIPQFDISDFGRTAIGPGHGIDLGVKSSAMKPEDYKALGLPVPKRGDPGVPNDDSWQYQDNEGWNDANQGWKQHTVAGRTFLLPPGVAEPEIWSDGIPKAPDGYEWLEGAGGMIGLAKRGEAPNIPQNIIASSGKPWQPPEPEPPAVEIPFVPTSGTDDSRGTVTGGVGTAIGGNGFSQNPRTRASIPLRGSTADAVKAAGLAPLYKPGESWNYGQTPPKDIPQTILDLAKQFNLQTASDPGLSGGLHAAGFGFDFDGSSEDLEKFAQFIRGNLMGQTLELIYQNPNNMNRYEIAGAKGVGPGTDMPGYYADTIAKHQDHLHWATDVAPIRGGGVPGSNKPSPGATPKTAATGSSDDSWMQVPDGWDLNTPIPLEVRRQHGIPDDWPPMFYAARNGSVQNVSVPADYSGPYPVTQRGTISVPTTTGSPVPGFPETNDQRSPMDKFSEGMSAMSSIAGDAFTIFQDVIASIGATANITKTMIRGFEDTESVVNFIKQFQTYIKTGADVAKLIGDIGGLAAMGGKGDPTGGASAAGGAIQAVAGIVQSALEATNAAITLGIDIYHQVGKYAGFYFGANLGGDNTGPLGGNVRMLLNTRTNELMTYSEDNALNKNTFNVPLWQRSYAQSPPQAPLPPQVNIYTGPGQTPSGMMQESMWLISTGGPSIASVSGGD